MVLSHVQQGVALGGTSGIGTSWGVTGMAAATAGDLVCMYVQWGGAGFGYNAIPSDPGYPSGFTEINRETTKYDTGSGVGGYTTIAYGFAAGGETSWEVTPDATLGMPAMSMVVDIFRGISSPTITVAKQISYGSTGTIPSVTPTSGEDVILWVPIGIAPNYVPASTTGGFTIAGSTNGASRQTIMSAYRLVTSASGSYGGTIYTAGAETGWGIYTVSFDTGTAPVPVADFTGTPLVGPHPLTVAFTDLSTDVPTSWAWDFGDGDTSTDQHPTHEYVTPGTYTVELVATNATGSDTETKVAYITVTDPTPGGVLDPTAADPVPITADIMSWHIQRGQSAEITGAAQTGNATVVLKNSIAAGASEDDKYNPDNAGGSLLAYLKDGTAIHLSINDDGRLTGSDPIGMFGGRTKDWTVIPAPGAAVAPSVEVTCEDALGWYARTPVTLDYAEGRSQRQIRDAILAAIGETRVDLAHEILTVPLSGGEGNALSLLEDLNKANGTRHFIRPATGAADWYQYVTRNRQWRLDATVDYSLSQQDDHVTSMDGWRLSADTVTNQQRASVTPIRFTPSTFTVWEAETLPLAVTTDRPFDVWVEFDDYVSAPTVDSAYSGSTPTITLTPFGTTAHLTITVASGTCTFSALSIEGSLARRLPAQSWVADDLTSQSGTRGIRAGSEISGEYVGTLSCARGIAEHVVWRYGTPQRRPTVTVKNWIPEMFQVELGDLIAYTSPQLGVTSRLFEVVGMTHDADMAAAGGVSHTATFVLQECRVQTDPGWFVLDTSELDDTDILGY